MRHISPDIIRIRENLTRFPDEILEYQDTLELLDLSGNRLSALPDALAGFERLRVLFLSDNDFD
jgi:Leucine-rich repeat (LRR) protein